MALTAGRVEAFQNDPFAVGLDLGRSVLGRALGVWHADPTATFRQGQMVKRAASGLIIPADGTDVMGVAKWTKALSFLGAVVDLPVVLNGTTASSLGHGNVSNVRVQSQPLGAGSTFVEGGGNDYILVASAGTIARDPATSIADGATVYTTFTFALQESDLDFQGTNFFNRVDDVGITNAGPSGSGGQITVIQDWSLIYTTQYDTSRVYAVNDDMHCGGNTPALAGLFTNDNSEGQLVGKCIQVPTASDPFLGAEIRGNTTT